MLDLVIKNANIATSQGQFSAEIGIRDGKITEISRTVEARTNRKIDASGKILLPGLVDGHTHMTISLPVLGGDDFESGTIASACGGVTTIVDFAFQPAGKTLQETYALWRSMADHKVAVDYSLHMVMREPSNHDIRSIEGMIARGVPSFKMFMTYRNDGLLVSDIAICRVMRQVTKLGGIVGLHCENNYYVEHLSSEYLSQGKNNPEYRAKARPRESEIEAVRRAITLAEFADARMYVVHMSTKKAMEAVREARQRGLHISSETCPHYLTFTDEMHAGPRGKNYVMSPPLRRKEDMDGLWEGLSRGDIQTIGSDHCGITSKQREIGKDDFTKMPDGIPGTETILPILFSEGVRKGRISLSKLVEVTSLNPAKQFGIFPKKGAIQVGSDADLVLFDPKKRMRLTQDNLHSRADYSIYENVTVTGYPVLTVSRGNVVFEDGQFVGKSGNGEYVPGLPSHGDYNWPDGGQSGSCCETAPYKSGRRSLYSWNSRLMR